MHAINVFDEWLHNYKEESDDEKMIQKKEWLNYKKMCTTNGANGHWYGKNPSSDQLKRAREDVTNGQRLLMKLLSRRRSNGKESACVDFPLISFVALFGGGGKHGYGEHSIIIDNEQSTSRVEINGTDGLEELIGGSKLTKLGLLGSLKIHLQYHRKEEKATVMVEQSSGSILTLDRLWRKSSTNKCTSHVYNAQLMEEKDSSTYYVANTVKHQRKDDESGTPVGTIKRRKLNGIIVIAPEENSHEQSWTCFICTFVHIGPAKLNYLSCEICGSERD